MISPNAERRRAFQLAFLASGQDIIVGDAGALPLPLDDLKKTEQSSPWVVQYFGGGLTAEVYRIRAGGRDFTLKKKRDEILVKNTDGETSFLNEVQRRRDFEAHRARDPEGYAGIVTTVYASLSDGIILSPWIEGGEISRFNGRIFASVFRDLIMMERAGIFECDPSSGNLLVTDDDQVIMFDFGYAYPFNPRTEYNSDGRIFPFFHAVERFETRCFMQHLMDIDEIAGRVPMLALYREEKLAALSAYQDKLVWLADNDGEPDIIQYVSAFTELWCAALASDAALEQCHALESFRSYVLDLHDDVGGRSCNPDTLRKADRVLACIEKDHAFIAEHNGYFFGDEQRTREELLERYRAMRAEAERYQIDNLEGFNQWRARRIENIRKHYCGEQD